MLLQLMCYNTVETLATLMNDVLALDLAPLTTFKQFVKLQHWHFYLLSLIEMCLIKYWLKYLRKRLISMDEQFIVRSLSMINLMISISCSCAKVMLGDFVQSVEVEHGHKSM